MPPSKHALLSASSSKRWINCPPSARLCERIKEHNSSFAKQGTDAHELCEYKLRTALGEMVEDPTEDLDFYDLEMEECANDYVSYILEIVGNEKAEGNVPVVMVEKELDFSKYVPDGFGTGDCLIISGSTLYVIDYKHGLGVLVDSYENSQMLCYALGAYEALKDLYDIENVVMTIFQPRRQNVSTYSIPSKELIDWAVTVLAPAAKKAFNGEGEFAPGDHCQFCKVKSTCRARAEYHTKLASLDFKDPELLTIHEVAEVLEIGENLISWVNDVKEYALGRALKGVKIKGYKVVEGRANRKFTNEKEVAKAVVDAGYDPYDKKLKSVTAMQKLLGKENFVDIVSKFVTKPQGKPTLVPEDDKRPAMSTANDFND
ncbi:MAG: DUF2800 domain-containing protein [Eubacterium coprostanoligenes]|nr:DUF2800 domain-containing protein [Eubacterium coprostanoligenes]